MAVSFGRVIPKQLKFVPYNGKIADITHADTAHHYLDLETALSETRKIVFLSLQVPRIAGTGNILAYPNEGARQCQVSGDYETTVGIAAGSQRLEYSLTVANDDFDLYCLGYVVEA